VVLKWALFSLRPFLDRELGERGELDREREGARDAREAIKGEPPHIAVYYRSHGVARRTFKHSVGTALHYVRTYSSRTILSDSVTGSQS